jgi:DNA polymerase iota
LSTRPKTALSEERPYNFNRKSKSQPLPSFVFSLASPVEETADRLVRQFLLPMFSQLNPEKRGWHIGLLNVCVTNMALCGTEDGTGVGRDISNMFRRQEEVLREWRVVNEEGSSVGMKNVSGPTAEGAASESSDEDDVSDNGDEWEDSSLLERCSICHHLVPDFALAAHFRYHSLESGEKLTT